MSVNLDFLLPYLDLWVSFLVTLFLGLVGGWFLHRGWIPHTLPTVGDDQTICVWYAKKDGTHRLACVEGQYLRDVITRPKGGPPKEWYHFSHIDHKGRFVYNQR